MDAPPAPPSAVPSALKPCWSPDGLDSQRLALFQPEKYAHILDLSAPTRAAAQRTADVDPDGHPAGRIR